MSEQPGGEILLYQRGDAPAIHVRLDGDTVWLSLNQLADLLGRDKSTISRHIANVFAEGELERPSVIAEFATTGADGKTYRVEHFNLDVIISVGYRVKSRQGTQFRIWATERLREYLVKGFAMDDVRLKNLGGGSYWKELLDRIRDKTLPGAGNVSHQQAIAHAETEYAKFRAQLAELPSEVEAAYLETVKAVQKKISGKKKP